MGRIVKMYEDFGTDRNFEEERGERFFDLKNSSEEILKVVGFEHEVKWFDLLNQLNDAEDEDEFDEVMIEIDEFLKEHEYEKKNEPIYKKSFDEHNLHPYSKVGGRSFTSIAPPGGRDFT